MKALFRLLLCILTSPCVLAQSDSAQSIPDNTIRRKYAEYEEEIKYYGKHNQYFTVRIFRRNGALFRLDSYMLLPKTLPNGIPLDSVSRIVRFGPTKVMYATGQLYVTCEYKDDLLHGPFMVFYEDGSIKRKEYFKFGRITKSQCYSQEGEGHRCEPFYQPTQFVSKSSELADYLKQKFDNILDGERVRRITATLSINEIGQVVNVSVSVATNVLVNQQVSAIGTYVQQVVRNMPEWTPDKFNWKPALYDGVATSSTCVLTVFRIYGSLKYDLSYRM